MWRACPSLQPFAIGPGRYLVGPHVNMGASRDRYDKRYHLILVAYPVQNGELHREWMNWES